MATAKNSKNNPAGNSAGGEALAAVAAMTRSQLERALASGCFEGFTPGVAKRLVADFGAGAVEAIATWDHRAKAILGDRWDRAGDEVEEHCEAIPMVAWLLDQGFSGIMARKAMIWQKHESEWPRPAEALAAWTASPYELAKIPGITFERADRIALGRGTLAEGEARSRACASEALRVSCDNAGGGARLADVQAHVRKLLGLNGAMSMRRCAELANGAVEAAAQEGLAKAAIDEKGQPMMFSSDLYEAEEKSAHLLLGMIGQDCPLRVDGLPERIAEMEAQTGLTLHDEQRAALGVIFQGKISIICGKPGSGKTTLLKCAAPLLEQGGRKVLYAAPTGKAAKRMSKSLGRRASTLHKLLSVGMGEDSKKGSKKGASGPSAQAIASIQQADAIVLDESSMLDSRMLLRLLKAIGPQTALILMGDPQQLPSVGAGKVLRDLIDCGRVPTAMMSKIVRQKDGSSITAVARAIGEGQWIDFTDRQGDCVMLEAPNAEEIAPRIAKMLLGAARAKYDPLRDVQVLAAGNQGDAGVIRLNEQLQALLNPPGAGKAEAQIKEGMVLRVGDKVMQLTNDYERMLSKVPGQASGQAPMAVGAGHAGALHDAEAWDEPAVAPIPAQAAPRIKMRAPAEGFDEDPAGPAVALADPFAEDGSSKGVFNGDVGYVESIKTHPRPGKIRVRFDDGVAEYDFTEAGSSLSLAYASTVHKFQGSEAPLIFFVMHENTPRPLRNRNVVYTALTRASEKCLVMGSEAVIRDAIRRDALATRRTRLRGLVDGSIGVDETASPAVLALSEKQGFGKMVEDRAAEVGLEQIEVERAGGPPAQSQQGKRRLAL